jgi:hypothetical protein
MIWSTSYHHMTLLIHRSWPHLLFTVVSVHRRQVLLKLHRHTRSLASKPPTCHSHLQPVRWAKSCLDLLHLDHMNPCHVSYAMSSSIITCASFVTSPSHFYLHGICCSHTCTCGLITCVYHINIISSPKAVTQLPKPNKDLSLGHRLPTTTNRHGGEKHRWKIWSTPTRWSSVALARSTFKTEKTLMSPRGGWIGLQIFLAQTKVKTKGSIATLWPWVQHNPNLVEMY